MIASCPKFVESQSYSHDCRHPLLPGRGQLPISSRPDLGVEKLPKAVAGEEAADGEFCEIKDLQATRLRRVGFAISLRLQATRLRMVSFARSKKLLLNLQNALNPLVGIEA